MIFSSPNKTFFIFSEINNNEQQILIFFYIILKRLPLIYSISVIICRITAVVRPLSTLIRPAVIVRPLAVVRPLVILLIAVIAPLTSVVISAVVCPLLCGSCRLGSTAVIVELIEHFLLLRIVLALYHRETVFIGHWLCRSLLSTGNCHRTVACSEAALLGAGLAMDAFTVSLANGLHEPEMHSGKAAGIAGILGYQVLHTQHFKHGGVHFLGKGSLHADDVLSVIAQGRRLLHTVRQGIFMEQEIRAGVYGDLQGFFLGIAVAAGGDQRERDPGKLLFGGYLKAVSVAGD